MAKRGENTLVLWGLGALAAWWLYNRHTAGAGYIRNLHYSIPQFRIHGNNIDLLIRVDNPNTSDIAVHSIVGNVTANSTHIGRVAAYYNGEGLIVHGNSYTVIPVPVKVNALQTLAELVQTLLTGHFNAGFTGLINIDRTPVSLQINYSS